MSGATLERRLANYFKQTMPLIRHYDASGQVHRIDGNQPIAHVTNQILAELRQV